MRTFTRLVRQKQKLRAEGAALSASYNDGGRDHDPRSTTLEDGTSQKMDYHLKLPEENSLVNTTILTLDY